MSSQCKQNFHTECEAAINKSINLLLHCSYTYQSIAFHYDRDDVALPNFHKFFKEKSVKHRDQAAKLMKYQNERGGRIVLQDIVRPTKDEWGSGLDSMQCILELEKNVNQNFLNLHNLAGSHNDSHLGDFLDDHFLNEQVECIKQLANHVTTLKKVGHGLGEYMFDCESLE